MKPRITILIGTITVLGALAISIRVAAQDQPRHMEGYAPYAVISLGTLGGDSSEAFSINNRGWVAGVSNLGGNQNEHAFLWRRGVMTDLGTLGGLNSGVLSAHAKNDWGLIAGAAEPSTQDPFEENFCGFGTNAVCLGFRWQNGVMTQLPTLGGNNGWAFGVNNRGQVVGTAENATQDPNCIAPQVFDWEAVIWGPEKAEIHALPPVPGDSVAAAIAINDKGQAVGTSGFCATPGDGEPGVHAVLWQNGTLWQGGVARDLNALIPPGSMSLIYASDISSRGEIVGQAFDQSTGDTPTFLAIQEGARQGAKAVSVQLRRSLCPTTFASRFSGESASGFSVLARRRRNDG